MVPLLLRGTANVTAEIAKAHAESEFEKYRTEQDRLFKSDFDRLTGRWRQPANLTSQRSSGNGRQETYAQLERRQVQTLGL